MRTKTKYEGVYARETKRGVAYDICVRHRGKLIWRVTDAATPKQASLERARFINELATGNITVGKAVTFGDVWRAYLKALQAKPSTQKVLGSLTKRLEPLMTVRIDKLAEAVIQFNAQCGLSKSAIAQHTKFIKAACRFAQKSGLVNSIKLDTVKTPSTAKELRLRALTDGEIEKLLNEAAKYEDRDLVNIIKFTLNTGLRLSEVLGLTWEAVDMEHNWIVLDSKSPSLGMVPLNDTARAILDSRPRYSAYVFPDPWGHKRTNLAGFAVVVERAGLNTGVVDKRYRVTFHTLRHTFATRVARHAPLHVVQQLLRHASITTTMRYAHVSREDLQNAVRQI